MKLEHIWIRNFKGIKSADFDPNAINVFVGPNGSGKSSFLAAIKGAITGEVDNPIMKGEKEAEIVLKVFGGTEIQRTFEEGKNKVRVNSKATTQKSVKELFESTTGVQLDTMKMLTGSNMLSSMRSGDLAGFLIENNLIPAEIDFDKFVSFCALPPEAITELSMILPSMPRKFGMETIEKVYNEFFTERRLKKKDLVNAEAKAKWEGAIPRTVEAIDKEIAMLTSTSSEIKAYEIALEIYNKEVERKNRILEDIKRLEEEVQSLKAVEPDANKKRGYDDMKRNLEERMNSLSKSIALIQGNTELLQKTLANLSDNKCPLSDKLICSTDKTVVKEDIQAQVDQSIEEILRLQAEKEDAIEKTKKVNALIDEYNKELAAFQEAKKQFDRYRLLKDSIPELPPKPVEPTVKAADPVRVQALQEERKLAVAYTLAKDAEKEVIKIENRIELLNAICNELNPKGGVYAKVMQYALKPMEDHCNQRAKMLKKDFEIGVEVLDGLKITCKPKASSDYVDLKDASSGEQLLAMFLLLDMINSMSGFGILLLDDLDKLDEEAMTGFLELLMQEEVKETYHHIFIAAVDHEDTVKAIDKFGSDMQVFKLS